MLNSTDSYSLKAKQAMVSSLRFEKYRHRYLFLSHDRWDLEHSRRSLQLQRHCGESWQRCLGQRRRRGAFSLLRGPMGHRTSQDQYHFEIHREEWQVKGAPSLVDSGKVLSQHCSAWQSQRSAHCSVEELLALDLQLQAVPLV